MLRSVIEWRKSLQPFDKLRVTKTLE
jgi:hypothetical protein